MRPLFCAASVLAFVAIACLAAGSAGASDDDEETPSIKTVMEKLHKGAKSPLNTVKAALKGKFSGLGGHPETGEVVQEVRRSTAEERPAPRQEGSVREAGQGVCRQCQVVRRSRRAREPQRRSRRLQEDHGSCTACHKSHGRAECSTDGD